MEECADTECEDMGWNTSGMAQWDEEKMQQVHLCCTAEMAQAIAHNEQACRLEWLPVDCPASRYFVDGWDGTWSYKVVQLKR